MVSHSTSSFAEVFPCALDGGPAPAKRRRLRKASEVKTAPARVGTDEAARPEGAAPTVPLEEAPQVEASAPLAGVAGPPEKKSVAGPNAPAAPRESPSVESSEARSSAPHRAATPPHAATPPREVTPQRADTPPREATPPREPTPPRVLTPPGVPAASSAPNASAQPVMEAFEAPAGAGASSGTVLPLLCARLEARSASRLQGLKGARAWAPAGLKPAPPVLPEVGPAGLDAEAGPSLSRDLVLRGWDWSAGRREAAFGLVRESLEGLEAHVALVDIWLA